MMVVVPQTHAGSAVVLEKPRVISEIRKNKKTRERSQDSQPRISGELEWGVEGSPWQPRHVEVRDGSLVVLTSPRGQPELRIPLRSLNLQPANRPRAFTLSRDQALPVATFQASSEEEYERWVKTLAVELMRQTPLEAVRFLDILGITASIENNRQMRRGVSEDNLMMIDHTSEREGRPRSRKPKLFEGKNNHFSTPHSIIETKINKDNVVRDRLRGMETTANLKRAFLESPTEDEGIVADDVKPRPRPVLRSCGSVESVFDGRRVYGRHPNKSVPIFESDSDAEEGYGDVAQLILKCQQVDSYVPVKEKRRLFESLCKARRLAQSTENLSCHGAATGELKKTKRARSLHDLSRCSVAVSEICRYFEQRGKGDRGKEGDRSSGREECSNAYLSRRRLQRKERRLERIKLQTADAEEEIWRVQEDMAALDRVRHSQEGSTTDRSTELKLYAGLEHRLAEEEDRLSRLQDEAARALREVELATIRFEASLMKTGEDTGRQ